MTFTGYTTEELDNRLAAVDGRLADVEAGQLTNTVMLGDHEERLQAVEVVTPPPVVPPPPVEPPPPPTTGLDVPANASTDWFFANRDAGTFLFHAEQNNRIPVFHDTNYIGDGRVEREVVFNLTTGRPISRLEYFSGNAKLTGFDNKIFFNGEVEPARDAVISGFELTGNSRDWWQKGVVDLSDFKNTRFTENWVHHNASSTGVRIGPGCIVEGNLMHDSEHLAIGGLARGVRIENNELFHNTTGHTSYNWEAGGMKLVLGDGLIAGNYVHGELAQGIWTDIDARYDVEENYVINNRGAGLFVAELSLDTYGSTVKVHNNHVEGNGHTIWPNLWEVMQAQILLAAGENIHVAGNTLVQTGVNQYGMSIVQQYRTYNGKTYYVDNILTEDNDFIRHAGKSRYGVYDDTYNRTTPPDFKPGNTRHANIVQQNNRFS